MLTAQHRNDLIAWTEAQVREVARIVRVIELDVGHGPYDELLLEEIDTLEQLHKRSSRAARRPSGDVSLYMEEAAFHRGLAARKHDVFRDVPWLQRLDRLIDRAADERLAFDVLGSHAAGLLSRGKPLPDLLADFVSGVLTGNRRRPAHRGQRHASRVRNRLLCAIIDELEQSHAILPTRNDATEDHNSGCDMVAEALLRQRMSPASYASIKRIWGNRPIED